MEQESLIYVLDTNVLLVDPNALMVFHGHHVVIPIVVIEEVDRFKKDLNETGRNARQVSRMLDKLREKGSLADGISLEKGGTLRVRMNVDHELPKGLEGRSNDNLILQICMQLLQEKGRERVVLVTRDTNMRIKGDALGITAEDYHNTHIEVEEAYSGYASLEIAHEYLVKATEERSIDANAVGLDLYPNQYVHIVSAENNKVDALLRYREGRLQVCSDNPINVWGVTPRNKEQRCVLDALLDPNISLVTITGMAGTGKTLLAIAAGLSMVADQQKYRRLVVSRPIFPLGRDMGFLPGDVSEKLNPWMKPIFDNLEFLLGDNKKRRGQPSYQTLLDQNIIEVEPLTYIRGRSLPEQFLIVDEAQNLTPHEAKTVISRAGEGTKVVLTGDPYQIDNPYVDTTSNGLSYVVERLKKSTLTAHITLKKGERSALAALAAEML